MKNFFKGASIFLGLLIFISVITWFIAGNEFFLYKFFAPKQEQVRREVFEQTKSYQQGMIQELQNFEFEYVKATPEQKDALASIILHRVADFPEDKLPSDLRIFVQSLKTNSTKY